MLSSSGIDGKAGPRPERRGEMTPSGARFGAVAQIFHWLTAVAVLAAFVYGLGGSEQQVYAGSRDLDHQLHESLGLLVFALVALRLLWRWFTRRPDPAPGSRWMAITATVVQGRKPAK